MKMKVINCDNEKNIVFLFQHNIDSIRAQIWEHRVQQSKTEISPVTE